jgi:hypothetical protein
MLSSSAGRQGTGVGVRAMGVTWSYTNISPPGVRGVCSTQYMAGSRRAHGGTLTTSSRLNRLLWGLLELPVQTVGPEMCQKGKHVGLWDGGARGVRCEGHVSE